MQWQDRAHFFAVSAQLMRRILVDRARRDNVKRGRGAPDVPLDEMATSVTTAREPSGAGRCAEHSGATDPRKARIVELRFFGGLSVEETAKCPECLASHRQARLEQRQGLALPRIDGAAADGSGSLETAR